MSHPCRTHVAECMQKFPHNIYLALRALRCCYTCPHTTYGFRFEYHLHLACRRFRLLSTTHTVRKRSNRSLLRREFFCSFEIELLYSSIPTLVRSIVFEFDQVFVDVINRLYCSSSSICLHWPGFDCLFVRSHRFYTSSKTRS